MLSQEFRKKEKELRCFRERFEREKTSFDVVVRASKDGKRASKLSQEL
jgi:hypothetical protein